MALMNGHVNEWHGIKMKENLNLACNSKQTYEAEVQACINMWKNFKKGGKACETNQANNMRNLYSGFWASACVCSQRLAYAGFNLHTHAHDMRV